MGEASLGEAVEGAFWESSSVETNRSGRGLPPAPGLLEQACQERERRTARGRYAAGRCARDMTSSSGVRVPCGG
jgi:hypothetical protein